MKKRLIGVFLASLMTLGFLPAAAGAEDAAAPVIEIEQVESAKLADTVVEVDVTIKNNPGFVSATIPVIWNDEILELTEVKNHDIRDLLEDSEGVEDWGWLGYTDYSCYEGLYYLAWNNDTLHDVDENGNFVEKSFTGDGLLCTLVFKVRRDITAEDALEYPVTAVVDNDLTNLMSWDMDDYTAEEPELNTTGVTLAFGDGKITMVDKVIIPGDANGDGKVNSRDAARILQYVARWDVEIDLTASDVTGDGKVNSRDAARILQYVAKWDVELTLPR